MITQRVACDWRQAYELAADPARLPLWASGLAQGKVQPHGDHWTATTPGGNARLRFVSRNDFGVLDHWVTPDAAAGAGEAGAAEGVGEAGEVYAPFRVIGVSPRECELQFTLLRQPGMDDAAFAHDAEWIARDLLSLKGLLEAP